MAKSVSDFCREDIGVGFMENRGINSQKNIVYLAFVKINRNTKNDEKIHYNHSRVCSTYYRGGTVAFGREHAPGTETKTAGFIDDLVGKLSR